VFNKPHPSILLHLQESNTWKVVIFLPEEVKRDILSRMHPSRRQEELQPRIQAHLVSVVKKFTALLEYQGILPFQDALSFLKHITYSGVHD
jgi:hypothetical protein